MKLGLYHSNFIVWVSSLKIFEEFKSFGRIKVTTHKKVFGSFNSAPHAHIGFIVSAKPCLNLCSFRLLNLSRKRVRNFSPSGSYAENKKFPCVLLTINFLKILIDLAFLISALRLFHTFIH